MIPRFLLRLAALLSLLVYAAAPTDGAASAEEGIAFFESRIRPVLAQECYECHSTSTKAKGGLLLDTRAGWQKGGDCGEVIVPGNPDESLLLKTIRHEEPDLKMPKAGANLDPQTIADFTRWIAMGAPDPREAPPTPQQLAADTDWAAISKRRAQWWSFLPITDPSVPNADPAFSPHPVDQFLRAAQIREGLSPVPDADSFTVRRRPPPLRAHGLAGRAARLRRTRGARGLPARLPAIRRALGPPLDGLVPLSRGARRPG